MPEFLEERLCVDVRMGMSYADDYAVTITQTAGGAEYRKLVHALPRRTWIVNFTLLRDDLAARVLAMYHRAYGMYAGFRVRCADDYSTAADGRSAPSATDCDLPLLSAGVYQMAKEYGAGAAGIALGRPKRIIYKPVTGTAKLAISGLEAPAFGFSASTTTGQVTLSPERSRTITGITQAASAVVTAAGSGIVVGESVYFSGVGGMVQINGLRGVVTATGAGVLTVAIDSSAFGAYTSGGTLYTRPQAGEAVTGGCEFDIPARFNSRIEVSALSDRVRDCGSIDLIELLAP